jgi:coenzyme A diphosphatase NUDT7
MNQDDLSRLKTNLPQVPGILGKKEYFNSAVLIPLVMVDGGYHFLFQKRAAHIRQGGEACFPGGQHDPDKDLSCKETAIRETLEELGIERKAIKIEGVLDTLVSPMGATVDSFIATLSIRSLNELKIDRKEVEKVFMIPVSFFEKNEPEKYKVRLEIQSSYVDKNGEKINLLPVQELELPERYNRPWGGRKFRVLVYKTGREIIWGITAEIIYELIQMLKK